MLFPILAMAINVKLGEEFRLKPVHARRPYPTMYRFTDAAFEYKKAGRWCNSLSTPLQLHIFYGLLNGHAEVYNETED